MSDLVRLLFQAEFREPPGCQPRTYWKQRYETAVTLTAKVWSRALGYQVTRESLDQKVRAQQAAARLRGEL